MSVISILQYVIYYILILYKRLVFFRVELWTTCEGRLLINDIVKICSSNENNIEWGYVTESYTYKNFYLGCFHIFHSFHNVTFLVIGFSLSNR